MNYHHLHLGLLHVRRAPEDGFGYPETTRAHTLLRDPSVQWVPMEMQTASLPQYPYIALGL